MRATLVDCIVDARDTPGAISFYGSTDAPDGQITGMHFVCPCGCRKIGGTNFTPPGWTWNGSKESPVISPSIFFEQGRAGEWHGWLGGWDGSRPGEWVISG